MMLYLGLAAIAAGLFIFGILYAILIYSHPWERTYTEVMIGVGVTVAGEMLGVALVLFHFELFWQMWWLILFPLAAFTCTGLPMMIGQEIKLRQQKRAGEQKENEFNSKDKK